MRTTKVFGARRFRSWILRVLAVLLAPLAPAHAAPTVTLPVQVYLYSFAAAPELDSTIDEAEVRRMFDRVNAIWRDAGVQWKVRSVVRSQASATAFPAMRDGEDRAALRRKLISASPKPAEGRTWRVVILKEFPVPGGGVYVPETGTVFFAETTRGGRTSHIILAHELGHTLGLPHLRESDNLMHRAAGARNAAHDAIALTTEQIDTARRQADIGPIAGARGMGEGGDDFGVEGPGQEMGRPGNGSGGGHGGRAGGGRGGGASNGAPSPDRVVQRMRSFERGGDGRVYREDVPSGGQAAFRRIDANGDGVLDPSELDRFLKQ